MSCNNACYHTDPVVKYQLDEFKKALEANGIKDFQQDSDIIKLFNIYRNNVKTAVADYMEVMKETGELNALLAFMADSFKPYYTGITTEKKRSTNPATDYYVTVVPPCDNEGNNIRWHLGIANDAYDGAGTEKTLDFAHRNNATVAINAGVYDVNTLKPIGTMIKDGRIVYTALPNDDKYSFLAIMSNGSFRSYPRTTAPGAMLADGAVDVVCIFGTLVENGTLAPQTDDRLEPRQSIGVRADGSTVIITVDGRKAGEDAGISYYNLALLQLQEGAVNAWALDGGGSNSTVVRGAKQNDDIDFYDTERAVNSFLYIAKNTVMDPDNNAGNDIGRVKQLLVDLLINKVDFYTGYIRLRGAENYYAPGIEMYVNAEAQRRSKMGMTISQTNVRDSYFYISFRPEATELSNMFRIYKQGVYIQTYHGTSSERPNAPIGFCYFDETINKPIWKGNNGWIDATGSAV